MPDIQKNKAVKAADLKSGDNLKFLNEGEWRTVDFSKEQDGSNVKEVCEFSVSLNKGDPRKFVINSTSGDNLAKDWGGNTENWVNKTARVAFVKMVAFGKKMDVLCLEPTNGKVPPKEDEAWNEANEEQEA